MPEHKSSVDLRLDARWVIPIEPAGVLREHSVIVDEGRIVDVLAIPAAAARYLPRSTVSFPQHALIPGLVNAHTHGAMTLFRGIADDVPLHTWLEQHIWPREGRFAAPGFVHDGAKLAAAEMLRGGITCCNDMYFYPEAAAKAYLECGMRAMLGLVVLDFPTPYAADTDAYLQQGLAMRDRLRDERLLSFSFAPHAPYTVANAAWERIVTYARQLDLPIQTHICETAAEVATSRARYGVSPLFRLHELGATGPEFVAIHGTHLDAEDIELLAVHGGHVVHCPVSNMKLASGIAPIGKLQARNVNIALGTDGAASNNRLDLFSEMRAAALLAKVSSGNPAAFRAAVALHAATLGGARALSLDKEIGSLVVGKKADIVAIDLGTPEAEPCYDPVSHLVHAVGREAVSDVWVEGEQVVANRHLTRTDEAAIVARARSWQERLA